MIDPATELKRNARRRRFMGLWALLALGLMFAAIITNAFATSAERRRADALHVHTLDVLLVTGQLETAIHAALRGERGYLLTGDRRFLDPYFEGRAESLFLLKRVRSLTRGNPVQQRNLRLVDQRLQTYLTTLAELVSMQESGRSAEAIKTIRSGVGRRHTTELLAARCVT